jgi:hypothetical protein
VNLLFPSSITGEVILFAFYYCFFEYVSLVMVISLGVYKKFLQFIAVKKPISDYSGRSAHALKRVQRTEIAV